MSQKLMLVIKQSLEFLDAFSLSLEDKIMFLSGQSYQVCGAIIICNAIQMMNYPSRRQGFSMSLLPYKYMLEDITVPTSPEMFGIVNACISIMSRSATLPVSGIFTSCYVETFRRQFPSLSQVTAVTALGRVLYSLTAIWACSSYYSGFTSTWPTSGRLMITGIPAIWAGMLMCLSPSSPIEGVRFKGYIHKNILSYWHLDNERVRSRFGDKAMARAIHNTAGDYRRVKSGRGN